MKTFTFALAPTLGSPDRSSAEAKEPFRAWLEKVLGIPVVLTTLAGYAETLDALRAGKVDAASLGDLAFRQGQAEGSIEPLLTTVVSGDRPSTYRSAVITRHETGIRRLDMLRGATIALVDGQSTSGYFVPRAMLREAGLDPDRDATIRLYSSHREVVEAVIAGEVDAGASHEQMIRPPSLEQGPDYARLRVVARSREIPRGPIVVRADLDRRVRQRLAEMMLHIHELAPEAARVLLARGNRYTAASTQHYPTLKSIAALAGVSYATVSRVINGSGYVAPETAARVRAIVDEVGYAPNGNARVLLGRQLPLIGAVMRLATPERVAEIERLRPGFERAGIPLLIVPAGETLRGGPLGQIMRDRRLGALVVGEAYGRDPEVLELARTGHVVFALDTTPAPGMIATTADTLVEDILFTLGTSKERGSSAQDSAPTWTRLDGEATSP